MTWIWVRETLNWADEEEALAGIDRPWLRAMIPVWNETFNITYQRFRHRVAEIAALNHSRVAGATVAAWEEIPDGALVLPTDDDDWFRPDAAQVIEDQRGCGCIGYLWTSRWIEVPIDRGHSLYRARRRLLPWTPPRWLCNGSNYAIVKGPGIREPLASHVKATEWFEDRLERGDDTVKRIGAELSAVNRTLGSSTTLSLSNPLLRRRSRRKATISRAELVRKHRLYRRLYRRPLPADLAWCRPYVAMMGDLMEELEVRDAG